MAERAHWARPSESGRDRSQTGEAILEDESRAETLGRRLVYFAAERTLMAWIRSALGLMALGFVIDRFGLFLRQLAPKVGTELYPKAFSFWGGAMLVMLGASMAGVAAVRYLLFAINYRRRQSTEPGHGLLLGVFFTVLIATIGATIASFLILVGD
jgi:inner membrane protein YidH